MIPAVMAMTIQPVNPGFFMMLFNLQRIEYNRDRKKIDSPENEKEYLTAEYFLILRSYKLT